MLNIVKNILYWADKEPMSFDEWRLFAVENQRSLMHQISQRGFNVESIFHIMNPYPPTLASKMDMLADILISAVDSLEYHPGIVDAVIRSLCNKAIVKKHNLFSFFYERYLVVPPSEKIHNSQARGVDDALAVGLAWHFTWEDFNKVQALIKDESLGERRFLLLCAFRRPSIFKKEEVQQLLLELAEHPYFAYEAKKLLKRNLRKSKKDGG